MFYKQLKKILESKGIDVTPFVLSMGMSASNVTKWKEGAEPRNSTKKKIADALGVDVSLFSENTQQKPPPAGAEGEVEYYYKKLLKADKATQDIIKALLDKEIPD